MELLKQLYMVSSPSNDEKDMFDFIHGWMKANGIEHHIYEWGITATKGDAASYPCVVAHMDEVHKRYERKHIYEADGFVFGYDTKSCEQCGIGADDKNGIWVALKMLERLDAVKVAFFVGEEIGCKGSSQCDMSFFDDCRYVIQCDRRNGGDFITNVGIDLCSDEFVKACQIERFGYKVISGLMTDVMELKERGLKVSAVNMSCGYYNPHTDKEYTDFNELQNCLNFVEWICRNVTDVYSHVAEPRAYGYGGWRDYDYDFGYGYGHYGCYDDDDDGVGVDEVDAYNFIYDELCWYDGVEDAPSEKELFGWWKAYCNGKGIGKKKFHKVYREVITNLHDVYGFATKQELNYAG